jgi:hypothetical protein
MQEETVTISPLLNALENHPIDVVHLPVNIVAHEQYFPVT